jgi:hypothetical protein
MSYYSRKQVVQILEIDEVFLVSLEEEEVITVDAPENNSGDFSEKMLERARVADNLVHELDINLPGAAVIVRMREEMAELRHQVERFLEALQEREKKS